MAQIKNPVTIVQGGGSLSNYGSITYLDANNVEQTLTLATEEDYLELTIGSTSNVEIKVNGVTMTKADVTSITIANGVQYIPSGFCYGCNNLTTATIPSSVHIIGDDAFTYCNITTASFDLQNVHIIGNSFLQSNGNFNSPISLPKIREIGTGFLYSCSSFNSSLTINDDCETIGGSFLRGCTAFAQSFSIPSGLSMSSDLINPGGRFMNDCKNFVGPLVCNCPTTRLATSGSDFNYMLATADNTAAMYTTGVTLTGTYASNWKAALPDHDSSPYRKLIVGS